MLDLTPIMSITIIESKHYYQNACIASLDLKIKTGLYTDYKIFMFNIHKWVRSKK